MLNIPKPKITYSLLSEDEIELQNVRDFDGNRITIVLRQSTPADLDLYESLQKQVADGKITSREMDDRSFAKLITRWGDRAIPTSLELAQIPLETRGVITTVFQNFCMPGFELLSTDDEGGKA